MGICTNLFSESTKPVDLICFHAASNCKQKDLKNMLVDNLLPELKLKQSNILTMGDFNFDLQYKNFGFSEFMEHTFSSKQIVFKVTRKYESLLHLAFLKVYPAKFYQVSDYRLSRASSFMPSLLGVWGIKHDPCPYFGTTFGFCSITYVLLEQIIGNLYTM